MSDEFLWVEKYRPKKISDTILPEGLMKTFKELVATGQLPNMIFSGTPGVGKTTVARALCNELDLDYILINGSEEGNIDTLRGKVRQFASTVSLNGGYKMVILDEADYLNPQSTQPALRGFMEEFSKNCRFILTANHRNRIIPALQSRCAVYEYNTTRREMAELAMNFFSRMKYILDQENVKYDEKAVADLIIKHAPDWRRVINECQRYSTSGHIDKNILAHSSDSTFDTLFTALKGKDFKVMRQWVVENIDMDSSYIFRGIYDRMYEKLKPQTIPQIILILAEYQYKNAFVADHEINTVACLTEIMSVAEFNK